MHQKILLLVFIFAAAPKLFASMTILSHHVFFANSTTLLQAWSFAPSSSRTTWENGMPLQCSYHGGHEGPHCHRHRHRHRHPPKKRRRPHPCWSSWCSTAEGTRASSAWHSAHESPALSPPPIPVQPLQLHSQLVVCWLDGKWPALICKVFF